MPPAGDRPDRGRSSRVVEIICVAVVILAVIALIAWLILHHGGGVLNQG